MPVALNEDIAGRLEEVARILAEQGANRFRVQAYQHAANALRELARPVSELFAAEGLVGLEKLPGVGESLARSIRDILLHGKLAMLDRLRGEHDPITLLTSVPGVGKTLAWRLHDDLNIETLEELEAAAHDGRLENIAGVGAKRLAGIRDSLAHRLGRVRQPTTPPTETDDPAVAELLDVDGEYRREATADTLKKIAPRRFNPSGEAWLPVLHTTRAGRHYTALFSNTAHAHNSHKTRDWVVIYYDGDEGERQCTVITSEFGRLNGLRIVRGREDECEAHYRRLGGLRPMELRPA
ncbi:MAG: DNA-binding protein [Verrucomicrobia bacterium]|nr:DNA-binding protein [Verrucomicrobiota bacterium]